MRAKSLTEHLESPSSKTAAAAAALSRGVPIIRRASSCSSDDSLTLENKGSESKPCAGDVAFNRALAALASQRRQSERQGHRRTRIDNRSDAVGASLSGERKSDPIAEDEDSHSAIHLISIVHSVDSGESSLHRLENESIKFECGETPGKKAADGNFCGECTSTFAADIEGTNRVVEEFDPQGNNASLSVNDLGISIVDVVLKKSHENASAISEDLLEEDYSEHSSSPEYSSDDESAVEDIRDEGRDVVGSTVALSTFECDAQSNPSRSSKVCMTSSQFFNMRLRRKLPNRSFSLLLISIVLVMACSIAVLVVVIVSGPHNDHQSTLRGSAVNQPQSTSTLTDKKHQPTQQPVGVQINSKSPTTRPSDFGPIPPASLQNMFDSIKSTSAAPTPSPVLDEVTPNFYLSSNMATPDPDTLYPMVEETNGELAQFEQVANVLTRVPNPIESITGCADTGTERYLFDNIITEFMCPPPRRQEA
ncbi:hypothetical protein THAOC_12776 [Thalassiosira oceanica]|uniref:Transmembrane protein n=1 Tax=Thalassiosira oceanica TaxID=159749 RepID=K0SZ58_THAOC|nr:hypothetical protein THAOC_12776 [Thalassiosira oceanica]|eukprot:EJK66311.1 hypothetical protein THAOC_12776 [Thalassiosira oceanica]